MGREKKGNLIDRLDDTVRGLKLVSGNVRGLSLIYYIFEISIMKFLLSEEFSVHNFIFLYVLKTHVTSILSHPS